MKHISILLGLWVLLLPKIQAQPDTFDLQLLIDSVSNNNIYIRVQIRGVNASFLLGSSAFFIDYNGDVLGQPTIHQSLNYSGSTSDFLIPSLCSGCFYGNFQLSNTTGRTGIGVLLGFPGDGATVPTTFTDLVQLAFPIINAAADMSISWRGTTFSGVLVAPTVVKKDDEIVNLVELSGGQIEAGLPGPPVIPPPFPVEFREFSATPKLNYIDLDWTTGFENNNQGFFVEKRDPVSTSFESIGFVHSQGNSTQQQEYEFPDSDVVPNIVYQYRLRQVDFDGAFSFSPIVEATISDQPGLFLSQGFPNPTLDQVSFNLKSDQALPIRIEVYNTYGQELYRESIEVPIGISKIDLPLSSFAEGMYHVIFVLPRGRMSRNVRKW